MSIYRIERSQVLPVSANTAWQFFSSPGNLNSITPPWLNLKIIGFKYLSDQINLLKINEISAKSALVLGLRSVFYGQKKWF
jgi:ligand-binding SRPBCC domain-containing protein